MFWYKVPVGVEPDSGAVQHKREGIFVSSPGPGCRLHTEDAPESPTHGLLGSPTQVSPVPSDWVEKNVTTARVEFLALFGRTAEPGEVE